MIPSRKDGRRLDARIDSDGIRFSDGSQFAPCKKAEGVETLEVYIRGAGFAEHRHDTYAIGMTISGVQKFRYRGEMRYCLPGQCHILHPDEKHDGLPGTEEGFRYRIVYVDPSLIQKALGGIPLPFVPEPVSTPRPSELDILHRILFLEDPLDELEVAEVAFEAARILQSLAPARPGVASPATLPMASLRRVRELIYTEPVHRLSLEELEGVASLDRWTLARSFRAAFGTSPTRFRTMRQLDIVKRLILTGTSLMEAAHQAGFSDQSHMTRKFKEAIGISPARWLAAHRADRAV